MLEVAGETENLARFIAQKTGKTPYAVVQEALESNALAHGILPKRKRKEIDVERVKAIIERASSRPVLDTRSDDEILGYNELGIPS
jgi:antitoxin VapB